MALLEALSERIRRSTKTIGKLAGQNRDLMGHLKKARNIMQQFKEQNEFLRQKLDVSRK
jgi:small-conductance mechanosensitive channel